MAMWLTFNLPSGLYSWQTGVPFMWLSLFMWVTFNLLDCTAGRLMSLLIEVLEKAGGGESSLTPPK